MQLRELAAIPRYAISAAQAADCDADVNDDPPLTARYPELLQTKPGGVWAAAGDSPPASSDDISTSTAPTAGTGVAGMVSSAGWVQLGAIREGGPRKQTFNRIETFVT